MAKLRDTGYYNSQVILARTTLSGTDTLTSALPTEGFNQTAFIFSHTINAGATNVTITYRFQFSDDGTNWVDDTSADYTASPATVAAQRYNFTMTASTAWPHELAMIYKLTRVAIIETVNAGAGFGDMVVTAIRGNA